jgi:peroxiredoxin
MKKTIRRILAAGLFFIFVISFSISLPLSRHSAEALEPWPVEPLIGNSAPDFSLEDLNGRNVSLSSFIGKPVLLNFWATWCPYCRKERAHLDKLYKDYSDKNLVIVSISIDRSVETFKKFMEKKPAHFVNLYDGQSRVASTFHVAGLPTSFLIDRNGIIKRKFTGFREWNSFSSRKIIDTLIED